MTIDPHTMTTGDVARVVGVSARTVMNHDAELAPIRLEGNNQRRYDPRVVERWVRARAVRATR